MVLLSQQITFEIPEEGDLLVFDVPELFLNMVFIFSQFVSLSQGLLPLSASHDFLLDYFLLQLDPQVVLP